MFSITRSIRGKIVVYVYAALVVIIGALLYVFINGTYSVLTEKSEQILRLSLIDVAEELNQANHHAIVVARTLAEAQQSGLFGERLNSIALAKSVLVHNPEFTGAYICYEPNADGQDKSYHENPAYPQAAVDSQGRFLPTWIRSIEKPDSISLHHALYMESSLYYEALKRRHNNPDSSEFVPANLEISSVYGKVEASESREHMYMVTEPYVYEGKLMVEHTYPIVIDSVFKGVAGVDKTLSEIRLLLLEKRRYKTENFILISRMGRIITSTLKTVPSTQVLENTIYGSVLKDLFLVREQDSTLIVRAEDPVSGSSSYYTSTFLNSGHWVVVSIVDEQEILAPAQEQLQISIVISIIGMLALLPVLFWIAKSITRPITFVRAAALQISDGDLEIQIPEKFVNADTESVLSSLVEMGERHRDELVFRQLTANISAKFVDIEQDNLNKTLVEALKEIGKYIGADRAYIVRFEESKKSITFTHTWDESGKEFRIAMNQEYSGSAIPLLAQSLTLGKAAAVNSIDDLPPDAEAERTLMKKAEIFSTIMVPLKLAGEIYGGLMFHAMVKPQQWQTKHFELLALSGGVFLNAINRLNREEAVRAMNIALEEGVKERTSELQEANRELEALRQMLFSLSDRFVAIDERDINQSITDALGEVSQFLGADRAYLVHCDTNAGKIVFTHRWNNSDTESLIALNEEYDSDFAPYTYQMVVDGKALYAYSREDLPHAARAERNLMERVDIKSFVTIPLHISNNVMGYLLFMSLSEHRSWTERHFEIIEMVGHILMNTLLRRQNEAEIRELNADLERRVVERTAELQAANGELEAFSYSVSHDLRAPLRQIDGFADLLRERVYTLLDEKGLNYLNNIGNASKYMGRLIDDLLVFSRMGKTELVKSFVDMNHVVSNVLIELKDPSDTRSIDIQVEHMPVINGDAAMLRLVFVNLIANAIKFTSKEKNAEIRISVLKQNSEMVFKVQDNGVGFDPEYASKLYGVFERLHSQEDFEGTGIGLANVKRIINRHGGKVWAEGAVNEGAAFYFSLPHENQEAEDHDI